MSPRTPPTTAHASPHTHRIAQRPPTSPPRPLNRPRSRGAGTPPRRLIDSTPYHRHRHPPHPPHRLAASRHSPRPLHLTRPRGYGDTSPSFDKLHTLPSAPPHPPHRPAASHLTPTTSPPPAALLARGQRRIVDHCKQKAETRRLALTPNTRSIARKIQWVSL